MKAKLNKQTNKVTLTDESVLLKDSVVSEILEYEPGNLHISFLKSRNLVKCEGFKKFTVIEGPEDMNDNLQSI